MKTAAPALAFVLAFAAAPLAATTFVMVTDEALVDQTPVVVEARVLSADSSPAAGIPSTDYLIEIQRVLKGAVPGSNLIVRVPGGVGPDGVGLKIWGAPRFEPDERAVLFLHPTDDGTFRVAHLMLGAFHEMRAGAETVLVRNLTGAREVPAPGEAAGARERFRQPRRREAFLQWIDRRAQGAEAAGDYFFEPPPGGPLSIVDQFEVFRDGQTGFQLRWFQFDPPNPETARWVVNQDLQPGLTESQLIGGVADGMAVWNNDSGSDVFYAFGNPVTTGTTDALGDGEFDGINSFQFDDPHDYVEGTFSCIGGGVLAIGGPWYLEDPVSFNGDMYHEIVSGDIVTNNGVSCFFNVANPRRLASELFGHELGHTLGLGHSCDDDGAPPCFGNPALAAALMNPILDSGADRGPDLGSDDIAGIRHLYGNGQGGGGGSRPAAPSGMTAQLLGPDTAVLNWNDNSNNETGFRVQQKIGAGTFVALPDLPPDTETATIFGLLPQTTYTWRVRALGGNQHSNFSNQVSLTTPQPLPAAPSDLVATPASPTLINLTWEDNSNNETEFAIELSSPVESYHEIAVVPAGSTGHSVDGLVTGRPYSFRVRARNTVGASEPSNEASATTSANPTAPCVADADTLCLLDGRFRVEVVYRNQFNAGENGPGAVQPSPVGGTQSGVFSFFNPNNVELIVKMVNASSLPVNPAYWVFYGALSTVEYWITVTDTQTGDSNTYHNPANELCGFPDTAAFPVPMPSPASVTAGPAAIPAPVIPVPIAGGSPAAPAIALPAPGGTAPCVADATTLCLHDGRFEVKVDWIDPRTLNSGLGMAVPGTDRTGYFWFFNPSNIELVIKILDATSLPSDNWWVFYGSLSDVEYNITVRDTVTGLQKPYHNEPFNFCGDEDTNPGLPNEAP